MNKTLRALIAAFALAAAITAGTTATAAADPTYTSSDTCWC